MAETEAENMQRATLEAGRQAQRRAILRDYGAAEGETEELLSYDVSPYDPATLPAGLSLPLAPEPYTAAWERYAAEASAIGAFEALRRRFPQLCFPIQEGISQTPAYRAATLRGEPVDDLSEATGLTLRRPEGLQLQIHRSLGGPVPVLIPAGREDFVTLVRALSMRNEPRPVPDSQGAATVKGFNNWDRIWEYRARWQQENGSGSAADWDAEFQRLIPRRELYQDHFIILSDGPYSNVSAAKVDVDAAEWQRTSVAIRTEHECTHTLTLRLFGSSHNNALDETLCDYMGIVAAAGRFRADWFNLFMGLESFPEYRQGGRLQNYLGDPSLSPGAFTVLQRLVYDAGRRLERLDAESFGPNGGVAARGKMLLTLAGMSLEEIAAGSVDRVIDPLAPLYGPG